MKLFTPSALVVLTLATSRIAIAQPAVTPKAAAQESYAKGQKLANLAEAKHDPALYEAAYLQFAQAYAIYPDDDVLWNLAATEIYTQRYVDALQHFRLYDEHEHVLEHAEHPDHAKLSAFVSQAWNATGHLQIDAPLGTTLTLDGKAKDPGGAIDVEPGMHAVVAQLGPVSKTVTVSCVAGEKVPVKIDFDMHSPAPVAFAPTSVTSADAERVRADGVSAAGTAVRWGLTGAAAVALGFAVGFDVDRASKKSDAASYFANHAGSCARATSPTCVSGTQIIDDENRSAALADVFLGVGVAAAAGAAVAWIFWPKQKNSEARVWVVPRVGPNWAGAQAGGRF